MGSAAFGVQSHQRSARHDVRKLPGYINRQPHFPRSVVSAGSCCADGRGRSCSSRSMPSLVRGRWNQAIATPIAVVIATALTFVTIALVVGRAQQVSFYRYATFATSIAIVCGILAWNLVSSDTLLAKLSRNRGVAVVAMAVCALAYFDPRATLRAVNHATHFAFGAYSIDTAYQTQNGLPPPFAIYAGARGAYQTIGPGVPIWALFNHAYCISFRDVSSKRVSGFYPGARLVFGHVRDAARGREGAASRESELLFIHSRRQHHRSASAQFVVSAREYRALSRHPLDRWYYYVAHMARSQRKAARSGVACGVPQRGRAIADHRGLSLRRNKKYSEAR